MFFGFDNEMNNVIGGLGSVKGVSFALIGGRRIGKTSFLLELERRMLRIRPKDIVWLPVYINLQEFTPRNVLQFYRSIAIKILESARTILKHDEPDRHEIFESCDETHAFSSFKRILASLLEDLRKRHGFVRIILLIDEAGVVAGKYWLSDVFQNLRFLLSNHPIRYSLNVVISAQVQLYRLLDERGSPLRNILSTVFLRALHPREAKALITKPSVRLSIGKSVVNRIINYTGGHPQLIQYIMWRMNEKPEGSQIQEHDVKTIANEYLERQYEQFCDWLRYLRNNDKEVLRLLLSSEKKLSEDAIGSELPTADVHGSLRILRFMGIIEKTAEYYDVSGCIMRKGFQRVLSGKTLICTQKKNATQYLTTAMKPTIGIITALAKEYVAVKVMLKNLKSCTVPGQGAGRRYLLGTVPAADGGNHKVVLSLADKGKNIAAARATLLLEHFPHVKAVIMVGIAGGIPSPNNPDEHVRLGDVVVSNTKGVLQYDFIEERITETDAKYPPRPPSASLIQAVQLLKADEIEGNRPWLRFIERSMKRLTVARPTEKTDILVCSTNPEKRVAHPEDPNRVNGQPRIFLGPIASANKLLKNPVIRDRLREESDVKAVEMEGSGVSDATWNHEVGYLVVRGICDYCDENKGDEWQDYAAIVAAAYTRALLESIPCF